MPRPLTVLKKIKSRRHTTSPPRSSLGDDESSVQAGLAGADDLQRRTEEDMQRHVGSTASETSGRTPEFDDVSQREGSVGSLPGSAASLVHSEKGCVQVHERVGSQGSWGDQSGGQEEVKDSQAGDQDIVPVDDAGLPQSSRAPRRPARLKPGYQRRRRSEGDRKAAGEDLPFNTVTFLDQGSSDGAPKPPPGKLARQASMLKRPNLKSSRMSFDKSEINYNEKRWRQWMGNNKFFWDGKIMLGVHYKQLYITLSLLLVTWMGFYILIWPSFGETGLALIGAALLFGTLVSLGYAAFQEPGIIPRRPPNQLVENMEPAKKDRLNYCATCHVVRPPRAKHCRHCNNCVAQFDHHCPWTGNCVGGRNYRAFFVFIIFVVASAAFVLCLSIVHIINKLGHRGPQAVFHGRDKVPGAKYAAVVLAMWLMVVLVLVGSLLGFHTFLLTQGQTTNEYLRGEKRRGNVPHKNLFGNCYDLWCAPIPDSLLPAMHQFPSEDDHRSDIKYTADAIADMQQVLNLTHV